MFEGVSAGFAAAFSIANIGYLIVGCSAGTLIGMIPGLGPMTAIALMIPLASTLEPASGIILMAAVYYGAIFGGSTSSILINAPGVASTVASSFDGFPLSQQGHAGKALAVAALSSFSGGIIAALMLLVSAPLLANLALSFHSSDYFALIVLGLVSVAAFTGRGELRKALLMTILGLMLSTVGTDQTQGIPRFTLGLVDLIDGISFLLLVMATFAISEALLAIMDPARGRPDQDTKKLTSLKVSKKELKDITPPVLRSSLSGFFVGLLPGAGATIASFLAYGTEQRFANKEARDQFGRGSLRGLAAPESANNAAATGSFVPMLTLGIPGSGTTAIMLGALIAYGIQPGPMLYISEPVVFWAVIVSMWLGNTVLLVLNLPLIPYIARLLTVPRTALLPMILFFSLIGVYLVSFNTFDIFLMTLFAFCAVLLRTCGFPMAPLILGFIMGGMIEENLRRALLLYDDSWSFIWERPSTGTILLLAFAVLVWPGVQSLRERLKAQ